VPSSSAISPRRRRISPGKAALAELEIEPPSTIVRSRRRSWQEHPIDKLGIGQLGTEARSVLVAGTSAPFWAAHSRAGSIANTRCTHGLATRCSRDVISSLLAGFAKFASPATQHPFRMLLQPFHGDQFALYHARTPRHIDGRSFLVTIRGVAARHTIRINTGIRCWRRRE
jgi:hypothetical protein